MTSHKHSFQCFDAVVEKPSLTAGHKSTASSHSSTCTSTHLEQLENRRCSLCSESQQGKPVTSEVSGNQPASWYQPQSPSHQHTPRRPMQPEGDPVYGVAHHHRNHHHQHHTHRHRKRIVLVKNSNLSIQKTILLHRKPVHSLCVFMDDVSELMQCHIRKLYTLDGHRVDSVQSLLQGPSVLVCVGREPFHPLLLDSFQKNSEVKLPKLILKPQSSTCNEDQGYKKNVNFGLKSKKNIPPRSFPKPRDSMMDDDIEKRVLVNKDGSLSMEMKVRFRLLNDETLHCSTEIKKSSCTFNVSFPGQDNVDYPHCGHSESCSEAESLSASEAEDVYISKLCQKHLQEPHCQHCCTYCQEYDIWKNPALSEQETLRHIGSTSLNASSHKIKCKKESFDSVHTMSCEEYTEQVVEKATCIQHTVGERDNGDDTVQYCTISRCSSQSEVRSVSSKAKKAGCTDEKERPVSSKNLQQDEMSVQITQVSIEDERPLSVETNSSDILASLKEDEDKEENDLSPSNSRASQNNKENDEQTQNAVERPCSFTPCKPPESRNHSLSTRSSSIGSGCSVKSKTSRKAVVTNTQENVDQDENNTPSSTPCKWQNKQLTDVAIENGTSAEKLEAIDQSEDVFDENEVLETDMRALKSESDLSKTCDGISDDTVDQRNKKGRSSVRSTPSNSHTDLTTSNTHAADEQESVNVKDASEEENIEVTSHAMSVDSDTSESPIPKNKTEERGDDAQGENVAGVMTPKSNVSARSNRSRLSKVESKERKNAKLQKEERAQSVLSVHSSASTISKQSAISELLANGTEDQTEEVLPRALSSVSRSSQISDLETSELREVEDQVEDRSPSIMSVKSSISEASPVKLVKVPSVESISALSTKTNISVRSMTSKISEGTSDIDSRLLMERVPSAMSVKSDISVRSKTSNILDISPYDSEVVEDVKEYRAPSAKSNKSNTSSRSNTPMFLTAAPKAADILEEERLKSPSSVKSSKSSISLRSKKSKLRDEKDDNTAEKTEQMQDKDITSVTPSKPRDSETSEAMMEKSSDFEDNLEERAPSTVSTKSNTPRKSKMSEMLETGMGGEEERPLSATSSKSSASKKSKKCKISEAAQECDHLEERPSSIVSSTSVKSKKSALSDAPCENEKEEIKQTGRRSQNALSVRSHRSRKSTASEVSRQGIGDADNRERTPSAMSCKSNLSDRSNLAADGVDNTGSAEDLLTETESAYEETKDDRAASALSSKSFLSNKSKDLSQERAPTSMSAKSNISTKSTHSKKDKSASILSSANSNTSAVDSIPKSEALAVVSSLEGEHQSTERTLSAMSGSSKTSKKSKKNRASDGFKEPKHANEEELVERSPSAVSAKSNTSVRSKGSDTQLMEKICLSTISPKSSASAKNEKSNCSIISNKSPNVDAGTWDIKIEERAPSDMSSKTSVSSRSVKSNVSAMVGGQTDTESLNERSESAVPGLKISMTEISNNADNEERASSALSKKSNSSSVHHTSERVLTPASASVSIGIVEEYDVDNSEDDSVSLASENSTSQLNSKMDVRGKESSKTTESEYQQRMQTPDDRAKSSLTEGTTVSNKSKKSECTPNNSSQPITDNEVANNTSAKKNSKNTSNRSLSSRSARTDTGSSKTKDTNPPEVTDRANSNMSDTLVHLEVNGHYSNANAKCKSVCERSKSNLSSDRHSKKEVGISRPHSADVPISAVLRQKSKEPDFSLGVSNHRSSSSNENGNKSNTNRDLNICSRTCNGSLVTTDCSRNINDNKCDKNSTSSCRHSSSSLAQEGDNNNASELVPSILPSSSPTEVVSEWLKKIPLESALYDDGDEFHKNYEEEELLKMSGKVTTCERVNGSEGEADAAVIKPENEQLRVEEIENNESKEGDMKETTTDLANAENIQPYTCPDIPSSVQLMRILLSPKLERCNSLPEVSPVYGRKLSMSARGFLDSLVNLQLLDFDPNDVNGKAEKYNDLMNMLQSLWLCDTLDSVTIPQKNKFNNQLSNDEEFNVKSSSGVDINSSSQGSGKSSVIESTNLERQGIEILTNVQEIDTTEKAIETNSDSATPDIASRVRWTPENDVEENMQESNILSAVQDFTIKHDYSQREPSETASISNKSSGNDSNVNQKLTDHEEDTCLESPSSEQMAQLTEKVSQDPDPVWVLNLLNNIEKQFMTHYVNAMTEFKVRWNSNNNDQLDVMICELRDEVHKRIQASINNELRKIQGHVGRPRPPKESMSRESSILRRRRLNLNQSIDPAANTDNTEILMNEFSDQQNDDEYCPCDTCMKKKMISRPVFATEVPNSAPLMTDIELRKILHLKRNSTESKGIENKEQHIEDGNVSEDVLLQNVMKENMQAKSIEEKQNESDTSNDKGLENEYPQAVVGSKPQEIGKGGSSSSLEEDDSDAQPNESEQPQGNNTSRALEQESPVAGGKCLKTASADSTAEEENAQSGPEIPDDAMHEDVKTETTWTNMPEESDIAEAKKSESTDNEGRDATESAEEDMKKISKESGEYDFLDEGKICEPAEDGDVTEHDSADGANPMNDEAEKEEERDNDELHAKGKTTKAETTAYEEPAGSEPSEYRDKFYDDTSDRREMIKVKTVEGGETNNNVTAEDEETAGVKVADIGETSEAEAIEDDCESTEDAETNQAQIAEDTPDEETAEYGETPKAEIAVDGEISDDGIVDEVGADDAGKFEIVEDRDVDEISEIEETPCNETVDSGTKAMTTEYEETHDDGTSDNGEASGAVVAENEETAEAAEENENDDDNDDDDDGDDERAEEPEKPEEIAANEDSDAHQTKNFNQFVGDETAEDTEMDTTQSENDGETADDEAVSGEIADDGTAEDEEAPNGNTADDGTREDGETPNDKTADDGTREDGETPNDNADDDGTREDGETPNDNAAGDGTAEDRETPNDNKSDDETTENEETPNDNTDDDGTTEDGETQNDNAAGDGTAEDRETPNDNKSDDETTENEEAPNDNTVVDGTAEDEETPNDNTDDDGTTGDGETPNDNAADSGTAEDEETSNDNTDDDGTTEDGETQNDNAADSGTAEDRETPNDNRADDETTEGEEKPNDNAVDDGRAEDGETPNDNTAIVGATEESDMEEVDETTGAETAEDGEQEDNRRGNGQIGDDEIIDDEATTGTENEENEETAEAKTREDGEIADNGTTEDKDTADERETDDEELSEHEIAQNGKIAKETIEDWDQSDDSESLEYGETAGKVNGETHDMNINTHNKKTKANSEMLSINVNTPSVNTGESDEGGDEAEDETEPIVETDGIAYGMKIPATQPTKWSPHTADIKMNSTVKVYPSSEDGAEADGEDSDTEVHNLDGCVENEEED
ncbi:uncharacterized protein rp1l1b [Hemibagrus wyckioides]|uniref:uncharacterized protein rp1l1b n=1 Tax=Hemibagrus wyckioides TaxID=337641 RepID=UPI00266C98EB|nr:uncharacterized protein rp1l1b [Hemibagrus wyckioides]